MPSNSAFADYGEKANREIIETYELFHEEEGRDRRLKVSVRMLVPCPALANTLHSSLQPLCDHDVRSCHSGKSLTPFCSFSEF